MLLRKKGAYMAKISASENKIIDVYDESEKIRKLFFILMGKNILLLRMKH